MMKLIAGVLIAPLVVLFSLLLGMMLAICWTFGVPIKLTYGEESASYRWFTRVR